MPVLISPARASNWTAHIRVEHTNQRPKCLPVTEQWKKSVGNQMKFHNRSLEINGLTQLINQRLKMKKNLFQAGIPHAGLDQPPRLFHGQHENKRIVRKDLGNEAEFHLIPWADSLSCELHYLMAVQLSYIYICNISNYIKKDLKNVSHSHSTANYLGFGSYNMSSLKRQHKF